MAHVKKNNGNDVRTAFDIRKTSEAAFLFIKEEGTKGLSFMKLLKLLYLADRQVFFDSAKTITGDIAISMEHGPVLSETYNCIKHANPKIKRHQLKKNLTPFDVENYSYWSSRFKIDDLYCFATSEIPILSLSPYEINVIRSVSNYFKGYTQFEMVDWCHDKNNLPEWDYHSPESSENKIINLTKYHSMNVGKDSLEKLQSIMIEEHSYNSPLPGEISLEELHELLVQQGY